jgi:UDP-2-acetamido-3-amino-2,3-dideoxy-glucuronate N-acetyltransferase
MQSPRVALIGHGQWGKNLARNFYQLNALVAICDINDAQHQLVSKMYPEVEFTSDYITLLQRHDIDAVVISTPAATHYTLAKSALVHAKDVFVEKPLALQTTQGMELARLAQERQRILMAGHLLRYHPAVEQLKRLIDTGGLGKLYYLYSNRLNLGRFRTEENILWSFAPHDISVLLYLLGEMPQSVSAHSGQFLNAHVADTTITFLSFPNGVRAHIFVSWLHPYKEHRLVVVGSDGIAIFADTEPEHKLKLMQQPVEWHERQPIPKLSEAQPIPFEPIEPLRLECQHFLDCVATRRTPFTDGIEAVRVLQVLEACQQSMSRGGAPITTSFTTRSYYAHETAVIDTPCEIGEGTRIWHFCHIMPRAKIGANCVLGQNVFVASDVIIGNNVKIQNNVSLYTGVILEDDVFCGPSMVFTNVVNPRSHVSRKSEYQRTLVKRGATLGANSTIVCGTTIGKYAFVGAGAVVTRDVPDYALVVGVPARIVGWMCRCGMRLPFTTADNEEQACCDACGASYIKHGEAVQEVAQ